MKPKTPDEWVVHTQGKVRDALKDLTPNERIKVMSLMERLELQAINLKGELDQFTFDVESKEEE